MKIRSITLRNIAFNNEINEYLEARDILPTDVINISQTDDFTTLWYWELNT